MTAESEAGSQEAGGVERNTVSFRDAFLVWLRIGCISFGGPAGQIALMHRELVEVRPWLHEREYLNALNFCMLLPGPEAMQLATYAGWRLQGVPGGLMAGLLFVLPGALVVLALTLAYAAFGAVPLVEAAFVGIKAAVLIIVLDALVRIGRRALKGTSGWLTAAAAFTAIFVFTIPFPVIVLSAALVGAFLIGPGESERSASHESQGGGAPILHRRSLQTALIWLLIWLGPLAVLWLALGSEHVLVEVGIFFSKLAVVTFGGAYAVLAYMGQAAVETYGWLAPGEMLDGLGLAETTPGPLILVTEFVGGLAAMRETEGLPWLAAIGGATLTLWVTFAPCFLWIFTLAPYVEAVGRMPRLRAALQGITAAVVGVILNLSLWFALHTIFPGIEEHYAGPIRYWIPPTGPDLVALVLTAVAAVSLFHFRRGILTTLALCGAVALLLSAMV